MSLCSVRDVAGLEARNFGAAWRASHATPRTAPRSGPCARLRGCGRGEGARRSRRLASAPTPRRRLPRREAPRPGRGGLPREQREFRASSPQQARRILRQRPLPVARHGFVRRVLPTQQSHEAVHAGMAQSAQQQLGERRRELPFRRGERLAATHETQVEPAHITQGQKMIVSLLGRGRCNRDLLGARHACCEQ